MGNLASSVLKSTFAALSIPLACNGPKTLPEYLHSMWKSRRCAFLVRLWRTATRQPGEAILTHPPHAMLDAHLDKVRLSNDRDPPLKLESARAGHTTARPIFAGKQAAVATELQLVIFQVPCQPTFLTHTQARLHPALDAWCCPAHLGNPVLSCPGFLCASCRHLVCRRPRSPVIGHEATRGGAACLAHPLSAGVRLDGALCQRMVALNPCRWVLLHDAVQDHGCGRGALQPGPAIRWGALGCGRRTNKQSSGRCACRKFVQARGVDGGWPVVDGWIAAAALRFSALHGRMGDRQVGDAVPAWFVSHFLPLHTVDLPSA